MSEDNSNHQEFGKTKKVIEPLPGQGTNEPNPALELIRNKIDSLFDENPKEQINTPASVPKVAHPVEHVSKHQKYMMELTESGKSLAEIQTAWHNYYINLPDEEKHSVWQEFYAEHSHTNSDVDKVQIFPPQQSTPTESNANTKKSRSKINTGKQDPRTVSEIKSQIMRKARRRSKPKNPHLQSILFGLSMGTVVIIVMLFGLFNERIIAPFISPSRNVSSTPIITDLNSASVGKDPKIIIPKINVEIPVVYDEPSIQEDAVQKALERGVLHYATTPSPGERGNAVIFGHSSNNILNSGKYKFAFVLLSRLEENDTFMLEKDGQRYVYKVFKKVIVAPTDLSVLDNYEGKSTVSLITCDPPGTSINRLVVVGEQISPSPSQNIASSVKQERVATPSELPSNSPSLWSRISGWF